MALLAALHGFWLEAQRVSKADFVSVSVKLGSEAWKCVLKPRHFRWVRSVVLAISWIFSSETRSSTWGSQDVMSCEQIIDCSTEPIVGMAKANTRLCLQNRQRH